MNTLKIRYFVEVGRCKNFSEAAKRLYTTQPNVSKQIAQMEQELGYQLFVRNKRSVTLTPVGQYLLDELGDIPEKLDAIFGHAAIIAHNPGESINIGVLEGQELSDVVRERFVAIHKTFPELNINLERNSFRNLRNGLMSGYYDIILDMDFDLSSLEGIRTVSMYSQPPAIAINSNHPKAVKNELTLSELSGENFIVISEEESPNGYKIFYDSCLEAGFTPNIVHQPASLESLLLCIELGKGIALLDGNTALSHSRVVRIIPYYGAYPMSFSAACRIDTDRISITRIMDVLSGQ